MGALTLKPSAYQARPWELNRLETFNHLEGTGNLVLHLRGPRVVRVTQPGWMKDRVRFLYDGLRRQRLTQPHRAGQPLPWPTALVHLVDLLHGGDLKFRVDPEGVHFFWLLRGYNFFRDGRGPIRVIPVDANHRGSLYVGGFGLKAVESTSLVLPGCLTWEEEGLLTPPAGGVPFFLGGALLPQVFGAPSRGYRWKVLAHPDDGYPREGQRALFQVSPLQGLLPGW